MYIYLIVIAEPAKDQYEIFMKFLFTFLGLLDYWTKNKMEMTRPMTTKYSLFESMNDSLDYAQNHLTFIDLLVKISKNAFTRTKVMIIKSEKYRVVLIVDK